MNSRILARRIGLAGASLISLMLGSAAMAAPAAEVTAEAADGEADIIVTAQRREQRLLETPISIGVLSGAQLDRSPSRGIADIINRVSGVTIREIQPGNTTIAIRGVVPSLGASTAGYYLDEIPFGFITFAQLPDASAYDLARVEVLRGPQGTLYGASALSGVVRVVTADADLDDVEVKGRGRVSSTKHGSGNYSGDVAVNVPVIAGRLAVRGVASYSDLSGFIRSTFDGNRKINDTTAQAYRLKINFQATDDLNLKFGYSRSDIRNGATYFAYRDLTNPFDSSLEDNRVYDSYNLIASYKLPVGTLLASTSYIDYEAAQPQVVLLTPTFPLAFFNFLAIKSFAQEMRFNSDLDGPWQFSAGGIYKRSNERVLQDAPALSPTPYAAKTVSKSYAIFGEVTRSFDDDRFEVTGGLRYFKDKQNLSQQSAFFSAPLAADIDSKFDRVTGRAVVNFKPSRDQLFYASVSTGFRSGAANNFEVKANDPTIADLAPDSILNYEVGAKGSLLDGALTYDLAVYYMDWKDIQQSLRNAQGFNVSLNAGKANGLGADAGLTLRPADGFNLSANVSWSGLEFSQTVLQGAQVLFRKGDRVNLSPEWTASFGASYSLPVGGEGASLTFSTFYTYQSKLISRSLSTGTLTSTISGDTRNLQADLTLERDNWSIGLYGNNLLDTRNAIAPSNALEGFTAIRPRPRTIGVQASFKL